MFSELRHPLFSKVTLALKGELDYGHGIGKHVYPVFKNFYGGGIGSVRGYLSSSLGAVEPSTNDALGGASRLIGNAELHHVAVYRVLAKGYIGCRHHLWIGSAVCASDRSG